MLRSDTVDRLFEDIVGCTMGSCCSKLQTKDVDADDQKKGRQSLYVAEYTGTKTSGKLSFISMAKSLGGGEFLALSSIFILGFAILKRSSCS